MIAQANGSQVSELGQLWTTLSGEIRDFGAVLRDAETSSRSIWIGQAGTAARLKLSKLATWCQETAEKMHHMGTTVMRTQAEAVETAQRSMPPVVPYDPAAYQNRINSTSNPIEWFQIQGDAREQAARHDAAHAEAVRVIETYSASLLSTNGMMPAFTPPPELSTSDTGPGPLVPTPGGSDGQPGSGGEAGGGRAGGSPSSGNSPHIAPGPGDSGPGGGSPVHGGDSRVHGDDSPDCGVRPPDSAAPTPGQLASPVPGIPGPSSPAGGGTSIPNLPSIPAGIGEVGAGRRGSSIGGARAGGGFGPRGSGVVNALGRGGFSSAGDAASVIGARSGVPGMTSRGPGSGPGAGGAFPPMAGGGQGRGEDTEHRRPSYLIETEDIWGDGRHVAPPVIGEDPPEYHY